MAASSTFAQLQKPKNQPYGDHKLYHFGFFVGMNFQNTDITNSGVMAANGETWYATIPSYSPGFTVGLIADLYLNPYMNLRFSPSLNFGDKGYEFYSPQTEETYKTTIRSNLLIAPVDVKFRSMRLNNYRPYVIAGAYAALDLGRKKDEAVYYTSTDFGLSIGLGCDFYLPIVKVIPELRFWFGLKDVITKNRTDLTDLSLQKYSDALDKGKSRMISLTFSFE